MSVACVRSNTALRACVGVRVQLLASSFPVYSGEPHCRRLISYIAAARVTLAGSPQAPPPAGVPHGLLLPPPPNGLSAPPTRGRDGGGGAGGSGANALPAPPPPPPKSGFEESFGAAGIGGSCAGASALPRAKRAKNPPPPCSSSLDGAGVRAAGDLGSAPSRSSNSAERDTSSTPENSSCAHVHVKCKHARLQSAMHARGRSRLRKADRT